MKSNADLPLHDSPKREENDEKRPDPNYNSVIDIEQKSSQDVMNIKIKSDQIALSNPMSMVNSNNSSKYVPENKDDKE